ncbi:MAG: chromosome segregation protein SMC [Endomicrobium sp.]|jgi:chromosome segregation protein|nr:chromosome segregation protein SMC [Endomicrobium sp.]
MYLKKLEISGFKSFAERTVLEFKSEISGIIGPNGCGKSNIVDSIRWCLGEQKSKSMRSSNMQEVIFSGTQTRTISGMAEVSLVFDNSQNVLPVNYSEVTITRKLFRSGESEYFINKNQCRLKDVKDIFLDSGLGIDSYSIIEQGKIDFLVTAKPESRRELFEEAAGVAKYKARREETLKRLEKVDTDISRLSDILKIYKQQMAALGLSVVKAKQYNEYQENLARCEISYLVYCVTCNNIEIEEVKKKLDTKIKEFESGDVLLKQFDSEIQNLRFNLDEINERYLNINKDLGRIKTQIDIANQIIKHETQREVEIKSEQEILEKELSVYCDKIINMEEQLKKLNISDDSFSIEVHRFENIYREKEQQYNTVKMRLFEIESKKKSIQLQISELESEKRKRLNLKEEFTEKKIHLDADIISLKKIVLRLESIIVSMNQEIAKIEVELLDRNKSLQLLKVKQEEINEAILKNDEEMKIFNSDFSKYRDILASNDARTVALKEFEYKDPIRSSIRAVLSLGDFARGPISNLIVIDKNKRELIASILGEKLNYLVCETLEKAEYAIRFLEDNNLSRLSFIIVEKISDYYKNVSIGLPLRHFELIKYLSYDLRDEKIIRFICSNSFISGSRFYGNVLVQGGGKIFFEKPILVEEQIKKLSDESREIKQNISDIQFKMQHVDKYRESLLIEKENLGFDVIKIKTQIDEKQVHVEQKRNEIRNIVDEIDKHKKEINNKNFEFRSFDEKISVFEAKISDYEIKLFEFYNELKTIENSVFLMRKKEEALAPVMMDARSNWEKKLTELENKNRECQYIVDNIANFRTQIKNLEFKISENSKKILESVASQQTESKRVKQLLDGQFKRELEIQVFLKDKQAFQSALNTKADELRKLQSKMDSVNSEINIRKIDLKNLEYKKDDSKKKLTDIYGKNYEEIKSNFDNNIRVDVEEIKEIRDKIKSLGSVNFTAQEEYESIEKKYNSLLVQQQDLLIAKNDLREIIKKINQSTTENFKKTFNLVRENFKKLYMKLFEGGEADLILSDENGLLESGIDILAQPPGKKLQNISLCSGGEKTLTAIALVFAFFMTKPSLFCILDEVDASLDDANVGRYNAMIKEFSTSIQFLVVTHNKRTMEIADVLYGVTMEEYGISKIISVKIDKQNDAIVQ